MLRINQTILSAQKVHAPSFPNFNNMMIFVISPHVRTLSLFLSTGVVVAVTMTALPFWAGPLSFAGLVILRLLSLPLVTSQTPSLPSTSDPEPVPSLPEECRRKMHPVTSYTGGCKIPCSLLPFPSLAFGAKG